MKLFKWIGDNILFVLTLFLLAFIPLYPKLPLIDIKHTWVYIRAEDFFVLFTLLVWLALLVKKKITLKTPLTLPILAFWLIGGLATIHGVFLIFPKLTGVFGSVAFLNYLRRIEYISLFFVAFASIRDKSKIPIIVSVLTLTLLGVIAYGFGERFLGFKAYLTMNEEFAKGIGVQLSAGSRIPSTFGGQYDLAAYLVLITPILVSTAFGFKNWLVKMFLLAVSALGVVLLTMTVSRVSFVSLLAGVAIVLFFQKRKFVVISLIAIVIIFLGLSPKLLQRFDSTLRKTDVLVSAKTGEAIGNVTMVPNSYLEGKDVRLKFAESKDELNFSAADDKKLASISGILDINSLPAQIPLVVESNVPTGENLPQGTGYVNLTLSPVLRSTGQFFYEKAKEDGATEAAVLNVHGNFLIKRAVAYDLSFTTRFQGEWPHAIDAFTHNILIGSGYSSVGLAVDNDYLRTLAEVGLLGFSAFFSLFLFYGIFISKNFPEIDSPVVKSFVLGVSAGIIGLVLNASLIDVFEASKVAYVLWLLIGITLGIVNMYQKKSIEIFSIAQKVMTSSWAIVLYILAITLVFFSDVTNYFFVGDDFTWFRWIADCSSNNQHCQSFIPTIIRYFTDANGFFYRPGTKIYFLLMYSGFWLNQTMYHAVSIFLHGVVAVLVFLLAKKIFNNLLFSVLAAFVFLIASGFGEAVFWISSTGFLFNAMFTLSALLFFILYKEKKNIFYFILSFISVSLGFLFQEQGVIAPLFIVLYVYVYENNLSISKMLNNISYIFLFIPLIPYFILRLVAHGHWFNGDYSFNLLKLPFNIVGNLFGYVLLFLTGTFSLPVYEILRNIFKERIGLSLVIAVIAFLALVIFYKLIKEKIGIEDKKIVIFSLLFFVTSLLPFLGLGNITSRYSYLSTVGAALLFVFLLSKLYNYLKFNGRNIAIGFVSVIFVVFCFFQLVQLQKVEGNWDDAGKKSLTFFTSLDSFYANDWATQPMQLYFVNVPIRSGDAWVFPVGLSDAVWLVTHNSKIQTFQLSSKTQALAELESSGNGRAFIFNDDGSLIEIKNPNK